MSLEITANNIEKEKKKEDSGKVFYQGNELSGTKKYSPEIMLKIFNKYEKVLKEQGVEAMKKIQYLYGHPDTWINFIKSKNLKGIRDNN